MNRKIQSEGLRVTLGRAEFLSRLGMAGTALAFIPGLVAPGFSQTQGDPEKPATNGRDALKFPRTATSMPGPYPGKVVSVKDEAVLGSKGVDKDEVEKMLSRGMCSLTGEKDYRDAWRRFVKPGEFVGLKVNPVAGKELSTGVVFTQAIVKQLEEAGLSRKQFIIWDRREPQLEECGFTSYNFPGIRILGTERTDRNGGFRDPDGRLYGEYMMDKNWYFWAAVNGEYDEETLPWMVNGGEYSYFSSIITKECDKVINLPILKNAGSSVTLCLKNLAYGSISNTGRLHAKLWGETSAEVCAFPPIRDKVVLNIVDGINGCFQGGPGADPKYFFPFKTLLFGTDPVAVDRIGYEMVLAKRILEGIQQQDYPKSRAFLDLAESYKLGVADRSRIQLEEFSIG